VDLKAGTAFFPSRPLERLPVPFSQWENAKDNAEGKLCLEHDTNDAAAIRYGKLWRQEIESVRQNPNVCVKSELTKDGLQMPCYAIGDLTDDIRLLQRAHMVLAFLVQYYVHSMPIPEGAKTILIPRSIRGYRSLELVLD
jgi:indoleamine 2,3-dioxygenase